MRSSACNFGGGITGVENRWKNFSSDHESVKKTGTRLFRAQAEPGATIKLGRVLAHKSGGKFAVGQPYLEDVTVEAQVLEELKGPKLIVRPSAPPALSS